MTLKMFSITVAFLFLASTSFCQTAYVYKYRAFQTFCDESHGTREISENQFSSTDFLVVVNLDKMKINAYGKKQTNLDLTQAYDVIKDSDGNPVFEYDAVDDNGTKCMARITIFKNSTTEHFATLRIMYNDVSFVFRLKKND